MTLRLVLADDSILVREGVARLLSDAGFDVVAQVGDADALLRATREHLPDVAIVDIRMPPTNTDEGLRAAEAIRAEHGTAVGILALSQHVEPSFALRLVSDGAGGVGYLLKDRITDLDDFADAIRRIAKGGSVIDPAVVAVLVGRRSRVPLDDLTERERTVLALMAEGRSNQAIADRLSMAGRLSRPTSPTSSRSSSCCPPPTIIVECSRCSPTCKGPVERKPETSRMRNSAHRERLRLLVGARSARLAC